MTQDIRIPDGYGYNGAIDEIRKVHYPSLLKSTIENMTIELI